LALIVKKADEYSVVCHTRVAPDCQENGGWCDSEEEAQEWVEHECWIFSGEGWICIACNAHFMRNLAQNRRETYGDRPDETPDDDLYEGIDTVR
jgi:hypothetical protein